MVYDIIIVGAGLTGLTAALELKDHNVLVLDKGKVPGGRTASRKIQDASGSVSCFADYGAALLNVDNYELSLFKRMLPGEVNFREVFSIGNEKYFVTTPSNREAAIVLSNHLNVKTAVKVTVMRYLNDMWHLTDEEGEIYKSRKLLLTMPIPQILELLDISGVEINSPLRGKMEMVEYTRVVTVIFLFGEKLILPNGGMVEKPYSGINMISNNTQKRGHDGAACLTVYLNEYESRRIFDTCTTDGYELAIEAVRKLYGLQTPLAQSIHRWKYAYTSTPLYTGPVCADCEKSLYFAGDAFGNGFLTGAVKSGFGAAGLIKNGKY